jgi:hypothetical protein
MNMYRTLLIEQRLHIAITGSLGTDAWKNPYLDCCYVQVPVPALILILSSPIQPPPTLRSRHEPPSAT